MTTEAPKTIAETRSRMHEAMRDFRAQAAGTGTAQRSRLADRARRAIERLRKQFKHKIDDMLRRDAKHHWGINESERRGLEEQLRLASEGALERLEQVVLDLGSEGTAEPGAAPDPAGR